MDERLFQSLDSKAIADLIQRTETAMCFAAPGIHSEPAEAIAAVAQRLGPELVTVCLDFDERVFRLGYGSVEAIELLRDQKIEIQSAPGLRTGLIIVDRQGFMFTPTALLLEADQRSSTAPNAMRLSHDQAMEALARLSPAAKAIALAQSKTEEQREALRTRTVEITSNKVEQVDFDRVEKQLLNAPPAPFDVARQVRVYNAMLQYVEISLKGASIQRHRLPIPKAIQDLGGGKDLEGRLKTTFDLLESEGALSSRELEKELNQIRSDFTRTIGRERVILKVVRKAFEERIDAFRKKLEAHQKKVENQIDAHLSKSLASIVQYYLPIVLKNPPDAMRGQLPLLDQEHAARWLEYELAKSMPKIEKLLSRMQLEVRYKDLTFESLNEEGFLEKVREAYPAMNWDKAYSEYLAVGEREKNEGPA